MKTTNQTGLKVTTNTKAGSLTSNHSQTAAPKGLAVRTSVKAGIIAVLI